MTAFQLGVYTKLDIYRENLLEAEMSLHEPTHMMATADATPSMDSDLLLLPDDDVFFGGGGGCQIALSSQWL